MLAKRDLTERIIGLAITVHHELGPGLCKPVYETCLGLELKQAAIPFRRQAPIPIVYRDLRLNRRDLAIKASSACCRPMNPSF
jgi:GxxExxY protein